MSFGFSVGDIITVSRLARSLWKGFADAPDQCKAIRSEYASQSLLISISDEKSRRVAGLYIVLDDVAQSSSVCDLSKVQRVDLAVLIQGCQDVLDGFDKIFQKQGVVELKSGGFRSKSKRAWERLRWDQGEISDLRSRLISNTGLLDAFNNSLMRFEPTNITVGLADNFSVKQPKISSSESKVLRDACMACS